jgi:hypothetical protein
MKYLHVAIIEDFEECLVSHTEEGLRKQVIASLTKKSIAPLTDEEWLVCVLAKVDRMIPIDNPAVALISYYKTESRLGE